MATANWASLPHLVLLQIFKKLNLRDLGNAAKTCYNWAEISRLGELRQNICFYHYVVNFREAMLNNARAFGKYYKYLIISIDFLDQRFLTELIWILILSECKLIEITIHDQTMFIGSPDWVVPNLSCIIKAGSASLQIFLERQTCLQTFNLYPDFSFYRRCGYFYDSTFNTPCSLKLIFCTFLIKSVANCTSESLKHLYFEAANSGLVAFPTSGIQNDFFDQLNRFTSLVSLHVGSVRLCFTQVIMLSENNGSALKKIDYGYYTFSNSSDLEKLRVKYPKGRF